MTRSTESTTSTVLPLDREAAFELICDASSYPRWLVGAQHIRWVDDAWPGVGAAFGHRVGAGPVTVPGTTTVQRASRPDELVLAAGMGPFGEATVRFRLSATDGGTRVELAEEPARGLAALAGRLARPVVSGLLWGRNAISLSKLAELALERAPRSASADAAGAAADGGRRRASGHLAQQ